MSLYTCKYCKQNIVDRAVSFFKGTSNGIWLNDDIFCKALLPKANYHTLMDNLDIIEEAAKKKGLI